MSLLDTISKPADKPAIITVAGEAGVGKTRFAGTFPKGIFIRAEDGMQSIPDAERPDAFPVVTSPDDVYNQLSTLIKEEHDYKTLVIDSVTALEAVFIKHVVDTDPKEPKSINQALGGYGAGLRKVAAMHARVRKAAGILRDKRGMAVVFIAHTDTETIDPPDGEPYTRLSLRLGSRSMQPYVDDVDAVGMIAIERFIRGDDDGPGKATTSGQRILKMQSSVAHVSKNRFGIEKEILLNEGENPLAGIVPGAGEK